MAKEKFRDRIASLIREISNKWIISIATGIASSFVVGFYAMVSPHVPIDLKQPDVLFILSLHALIFVSGCILVLFGHGWRMRLLPLLMPLVAGISLFFYYEKFVIYGINSVDGPKVIVFYPDVFEDTRLKAEWRRSLREIPNSITVEGTQIKLLKWPNRFSNEIGKTVIGRIINKRADVIGHVSMNEEPDGVLLQLNLPSLQSYQDLGLSWVTTAYTNDETQKIIKLSAGFGSFDFIVDINLNADGPHLGHPIGHFSIGAARRSDPIGLDDISERRNLPVAEILQVPDGSLTRGTYFACYMLSVAYFRLVGYEESYCDALDRFTKFDEKNPEFDLLRELDASSAAVCLYEKGPEFIKRIVTGLPDEDQDEILSGVLQYLLTSHDYDRQYAESNLFSKNTVNSIIDVRKSCRLSETDLNGIDQADCILEIMVNNESFKDSHPLFWRTIADKVDKLTSTWFGRKMYYLNPAQLDSYMVRQHKVMKFLGGDRKPCEFSWFMYLLPQIMQIIGREPDNTEVILDSIADRMLAITKETDCNEIKIFDWDISEFLNSAEQRHATTSDLRELLRIIENNGKIREIIAQSKVLITPFVSKDSKFLPFFDDPDFYDPAETLKLAVNFLVEPVRNTSGKHIAYKIQSAFDIILADLNSKQVFDATVDEFFEMFKMDTDWLDEMVVSSMTPLLSLENNLQDPIANEALRILKKELAGQEEDSENLELQPSVIKNPLHTILLYQKLKDRAGSPDDVSRLLKSMTTNYQKEKKTALFKHFQMIQAHYTGNGDKAIKLAGEIIDVANIPQQSFYLFYVDSMKQNEVEVRCVSPTEELPAWTWRMLDHDRKLLIDHLLQNRFDENLWQDAADDYPPHSIYSGDEINTMHFKQTLAHYLLNYSLMQPGAGPLSHEEFIEEPDNALLQAIAASKKACMQ